MARKVTKIEKPKKSSSIGERIKYLRTQRLMTQGDLAKIMSRKRSEITMYETGARSFDFVTLVKFADVLNVSTDYLLGRTDVESDESDIKNSINTTGLSEKAILTLRNLNISNLNKIELINFLIEQDYISNEVSEYFKNNEQLETNHNKQYDNKSLRKQLKFADKIINESKKRKSILDNLLNYMTTKIKNQKMYISSDEVISDKKITSNLYDEFANIISNEVVDGNEIVDKILLDKIVENLKLSKNDYLKHKDGDN